MEMDLSSKLMQVIEQINTVAVLAKFHIVKLVHFCVK